MRTHRPWCTYCRNGTGNNVAVAVAAAGGEASAEDATATTGYSLEALSKELVPEMAKTASMKELFGVKR